MYGPFMRGVQLVRCFDVHVFYPQERSFSGWCLHNTTNSHIHIIYVKIMILVLYFYNCTSLKPHKWYPSSQQASSTNYCRISINDAYNLAFLTSYSRVASNSGWWWFSSNGDLVLCISFKPCSSRIDFKLFNTWWI